MCRGGIVVQSVVLYICIDIRIVCVVRGRVCARVCLVCCVCGLLSVVFVCACACKIYCLLVRGEREEIAREGERAREREREIRAIFI